MRWTPGRRSRNLEDRRGRREGPSFPFRLPPLTRIPGGRLPGGRAPQLGFGGILLLLLLFWFLGGDVLQILGGGTQVSVPESFPGERRLPPVGTPAPSASPEEERLVDFVSFVLDDLQSTWTEVLPGYRDAVLVLFRGSTVSGCGRAVAQMGPFYCPADEKVYVDLGFYEELRRRFGAPGDFAQAYVLAHEIGHHVQKLTGIEPKVRRAQQERPSLANELSVRMELQADCLAGVWGHSTGRRELLEEGDVEEAMNAASAIGDDRIQRETTGRVQPESFTHGSSRQRMEWFQRGLETGDLRACDTLSASAR